jgi:hypothetical protein
MDFSQRKLSKAEWESIEVPVKDAEKHILMLIKKGAQDVNIRQNRTVVLLDHLKIASTPLIDDYRYVTYFQPTVLAVVHTGPWQTGTWPPGSLAPLAVGAANLKKADVMRLANTDKLIQTNKTFIFEYVLLDLFTKLCTLKHKNSNWLLPFYTLQTLLQNHIKINARLRQTLDLLLQPLNAEVDMAAMLHLSKQLIEQNEYLLQYADETLYEHQKQLFTVCKQAAPKLILYIAPTGTGKTLSPIGLSEQRKIIFVCAARHVGLALAKAAIAMQKRVAFAFGCNDAADIRLHYYAAQEFTRNKKSGGIGKVDNTQGEKVEIIISDIQSYLPAMFYLLAFNPKENIVLYWDEPTITLDYAQHDLHAIIKKNWTENVIPNIVLSSATLPQGSELAETSADFCARFAGGAVHEIVSYDVKKTIPLIGADGFIAMPHYMSADYTAIQIIVTHCQTYKTLLRYLDLQEAVDFIETVNPRYVTSPRYALAVHFPNWAALNMANIKLYYLTLLGQLNPADWPALHSALLQKRSVRYASTMHLVTTDAHTLTDGPTIFLAQDVHKVAQYYMQSCELPASMLQDILRTIQANTLLNEKIAALEKEFEDGTAEDAEKEKKQMTERMDPKMKARKQKIELTRTQLKTISLDPVFVPNTEDHLYKYARKRAMAQGQAQGQAQAMAQGQAQAVPFTSDISDFVVEQIMQIDDVPDSWKVMLLMGIGVFASQNPSARYMEVMKRLAQEQKLYLILASSDYIYGTNYQFCHGYIGKDLSSISQEKCVQALGRVGRNSIQQDYSVRFRDNELLYKLFRPDANKPEVANMNKLFVS